MISKWIKRIVYLLSLVAMFIITVCNIVYINQISNYEVSNIEYYGILKLFTSFMIAISIIGISYGLGKIKVERKFKIAIIILFLLLYAILQVVWISQSVASPYADSEQLLVIAKEMMENEGLSEYCANYVQYYPQQLTLVAIMIGLFKIFHTTSYVIFQYANVICNVLSILGLYAITKKISKEKNNNMILFWVLSLTFIPIIMLSTFVYGDFLGLAFAIWSVYFAINYEKTNQVRNVIFTAICISIACLLRMNYFIFAIAVAIYWIINLFDKKDEKQIIQGIGILILLVVIIMIPNKLIKNIYGKKYNLSNEKSFSTIPYLYMGMSEGEFGNGWYNNQMGNTVYHLMNDEKEEAEKVSGQCTNDFRDRAKDLIKNPIYTVKFYSKKIITTWAEPTMEYGFYNTKYPESTNIEEHRLANYLTSGKTYEIIKVYQKSIIFIIFIGSMLSIIKNRRKLNTEIVLLCLIFLGGFCFHFLWETKSRYIIPYIFILIPVAVDGIEMGIQKIKNNWKREK